MKRLIVTTSWDDGHKLDVRLADLLRKYNIPATFYISPNDNEFKKEDLLTDEQIKELSRDFEIGAHTMTHPRLPNISDDEARREMAESKSYLEALIGKPVVSFCYPGGNYSPQHPKMAKELGFSYARTVKRHVTDLQGSPFEAHTAVNAYNHYQDLPKIAALAGYNPLKIRHFFKWENLAKGMFDKLRRAGGGIFHLWGHSWEIDQHGDWDKLEEVLRYISGHDDVLYVTNGQLTEARPKHVFVAAPYFPPHLGGQEQYAYHIAKRLKDEHRWDVTVATTGRRGLRSRRVTYGGVEVHQLPYWFKLSNTPINPFWPFMLKRLIKASGADVVNAHAPVPGFGDIAVLVSGDVPSILTYHMASMKKHDGRYDWLIHWYESRFLPRVMDRAKALVATSTVVRDMHMQPHAAKTIMVTPGADTSFFVPGPGLAKNTVLFAGGINKSHAHKGLIYLLNAFKTVAANNPESRLLIAGDGSARPSFEAYVREQGLAERVEFLGALVGEDLKRAYQQATLLVLPSLNESVGMVMLEAMASGLPVIGTSVGDIPTFIDDGQNGYVVPPADSAALAGKIQVLLNNDELARQLGLAARAKAEAHFGWEHKVKATDELLKSVLTHQPRERS